MIQKLPLIVFLFLFGAGIALGASRVYFDRPDGDIAVGSESEMRLLVDTDQPLNAYSVEFSYPPDSLNILGFDNSRSIIDVWQGQPLVFIGGSVTFNGGSLKPFIGNKGELLAIKFAPLREGSAAMNLSHIFVYKADGKGTKISPTFESVRFTVLPPRAAPRQGIPARDTAPPEIRFLSFVPDPFVAERKLLAFSVYDGESGIQATFTRSRSFLFWDEWQAVNNPTSVRRDAWSVGFRVIDNQGNASERVLYDWSALKGFAFIMLALIALTGFFAVLILKKLRKSYNKGKQ